MKAVLGIKKILKIKTRRSAKLVLHHFHGWPDKLI